MSLWAQPGRPATSDLLRDFSETTAEDSHLWRFDILGSIAHVGVLEEAGLLSAEEAVALRSGLRSLLTSDPRLSVALEDVHMNVEDRLTKLTPVGAKLHTARSRNDQVALDLRLFARTLLMDLADALGEYASVLLRLATEHADDPLPGRTHFQPAQAISLGQHFHAHAARALRDLARVDAAFRSANVSPLGAGALAGTTLGTNPHVAAQALAMDGTFANTLDAVSDRDFAVDALHAGALAAIHFSSLGEEFVLWSTPEFGYVKLPPELTTGSSLMPQKRNPDGAELLRSAASTALADYQACAGILRSLPLAYNRDLQDTKPPLIRTLPRAVMATRLATAMVDTAVFDTRRMREGLARGHPEATDAADLLVRQGVPFREAHHRIATLVAEADRRGTTLSALPVPMLHEAGLPLMPSADPSVKSTPGGPAAKLVRAATDTSWVTLNSWKKTWSDRRATIARAERSLEGIA
ncbi:MAG: argininosuccinate lyase [Thermoplasmatota archaeon]